MSTPDMKPDHTIDDLLDSLVVRASRLGLSKRELARRAKLHFNTLTAFGRKNWSPGVSVLRRIETSKLFGLVFHRLEFLQPVGAAHRTQKRRHFAIGRLSHGAEKNQLLRHLLRGRLTAFGQRSVLLQDT